MANWQWSALSAARIVQYLGWIEGLGILNSWGNSPEYWPFADDSTNTLIPFSLQVEEIADAILFVASDKAALIAGQIIKVNGGKTLSPWDRRV